MSNIYLKHYFSFLSFMLILTTYLPVVSKNLPPIVGSYIFYSIIWFFSILLFRPVVLRQKLVLLFLLYGLFYMVIFKNLFWFMMNDSNSHLMLVEFYNFMVPITILYYYKVNKDFKGLARLTLFAIIFIGITGVMSVISSEINPNYARYMTGNVFSDSDFNFFTRLGGGGYGYNNALIGVFPLLFYYYKNPIDSIFSKRTIVIYGIFTLFIIIKLQFFTNIIMSLFVIAISFPGNRNRYRYYLVLFLFGILLSLISVSTYSYFLKDASSLFDSKSENYSKLNDLSEYIMGNTKGSGTEVRTARWPELIDAFLRSPLLGDSFHNNGVDISLGFHLYWMNRLALWGVFGFLLYVWLHAYYIKSILKTYNKEYKLYALISFLGILGYGIMKNISGREVWVFYFILIPGVYYLPTLKKKINNVET